MDPLVSIVGFAAFAVVLAAGIILFRNARKKTAGVTYSPVVVATPAVSALKTESSLKPSEPVSDGASQASYLKVGRSLADWVKERHREEKPQKVEEKIAA